MKKLIALFLTAIMLLSLAACGGKPESPEKDGTPQDAEQNDALQVDEGLLTVEITLDASFFDGKTPEEIQADAKEEGFLSCTVNEDDSVTYTMTKLQHRKMLEEMKASIAEAVDGLLSGDSKVASFVSIDYADDLSRFDVYVDPAKYTELDNLFVLTFYIAGAYYQAFDGAALDEIDIVVSFIDNETKEVLKTASYQDYVKNQN